MKEIFGKIGYFNNPNLNTNEIPAEVHGDEDVFITLSPKQLEGVKKELKASFENVGDIVIKSIQLSDLQFDIGNNRIVKRG